jgi:hypothetical protein
VLERLGGVARNVVWRGAQDWRSSKMPGDDVFLAIRSLDREPADHPQLVQLRHAWYCPEELAKRQAICKKMHHTKKFLVKTQNICIIKHNFRSWH